MEPEGSLPHSQVQCNMCTSLNSSRNQPDDDPMRSNREAV
jgi:hypothetical protein